MYRRLLEWSNLYCNTFQVVIRVGEPLSKNAQNFLQNLKSLLLSSTFQSTWHGTEVLNGSKALINRYKLTSVSMDLLINSSNGLFEWNPPALPEDLCLLRSDGSIWLASTAHEWVAWFELNALELSDLINNIPEIAPLLDETMDNIIDPYGVIELNYKPTFRELKILKACEVSAFFENLYESALSVSERKDSDEYFRDIEIDIQNLITRRLIRCIRFNELDCTGNDQELIILSKNESNIYRQRTRSVKNANEIDDQHCFELQTS